MIEQPKDYAHDWNRQNEMERRKAENRCAVSCFWFFICGLGVGVTLGGMWGMGAL